MAEFKNVTKSFGDVTVIKDFSLKIEKGSPTVIMGESGSGKTTLLRIAAGLEKADSGMFDCGGESVAYMFQESRLLPWKNAKENITAVLPKSNLFKADEYLLAVGLDPKTDGSKFPSELSGGMRQRVAFARFLAYTRSSNATLLLLDEPFSSLDEETAGKMIRLLKGISKDKKLLLVTHDESDAQMLGAKIVRL